MSQTKERKTETLLEAKKIMHMYQKEAPKAVYVIGEPRTYENGEGENKRYVQEFYGSFLPPKEDGSPADPKKRGLFRAETTEPFQPLADFANKPVQLLVSGQTFKVEGKNKEGRAIIFPKTFVRSIKTAKTETREKDGETFTVTVGDKDVMPASICTKREYYAANNRSLSGYINWAELNKKMEDKNGQVFGYAQLLLVGSGGDSTKVKFFTSEPVDEAEFAKGRRISMPGAMRVHSYFNKKEQKYVKSEIFEPNYIAYFKEPGREAGAAKDAQEPAGMTPEEIMDADTFVPGDDIGDDEEMGNLMQEFDAMASGLTV